MRTRFDPKKHEYWIDGRRVPGVTDTLRDLGIIDDRFYTEESRKRGTVLHRNLALADAELLDETKLVDWPGKPYLDCWRKFCREEKFKPAEIEISLFHQIFQFGGTLDRIGTCNGVPTIVDIKTGPIYPWVSLQLMGYLLLAVGNLMQGWPIRVAVQLRPGKNPIVKRFDDPLDRDVFLGLLSGIHWKRRNCK